MTKTSLHAPGRGTVRVTYGIHDTLCYTARLLQLGIQYAVVQREPNVWLVSHPGPSVAPIEAPPPVGSAA